MCLCQPHNDTFDRTLKKNPKSAGPCPKRYTPNLTFDLHQTIPLYKLPLVACTPTATRPAAMRPAQIQSLIPYP